MSKKRPTLMGFPVVEADDLPDPGPITFDDLSAYICAIPASSTPIADALVALRGAGVLAEDDCETLADLLGVRTLGDLVVVLARGEITDEKLAGKLRTVLSM